MAARARYVPPKGNDGNAVASAAIERVRWLIPKR
jgi:hypothetical protein